MSYDKAENDTKLINMQEKVKKLSKKLKSLCDEVRELNNTCHLAKVILVDINDSEQRS